MMKNLILIFISFSCLFLSCGEAEDNTPTFEEMVIGDWNINSFVINCDNPDYNEPIAFANENGCVEIFGISSCITMSFRSDGTAELREESLEFNYGVYEFSYELDVENSALHLCNEQYGDCSTFIFRDGQIYDDQDEDGCVCTTGYARD